MAAAGLACVLSTEPAGGAEFFGVVHSTPPGDIVVLVSTELLTFEMTPQTAVRINGVPASSDDLRSGDAVYVTATGGAGRFPAAVTVTARRAGHKSLIVEARAWRV